MQQWLARNSHSSLADRMKTWTPILPENTCSLVLLSFSKLSYRQASFLIHNDNIISSNRSLVQASPEPINGWQVEICGHSDCENTLGLLSVPEGDGRSRSGKGLISDIAVSLIPTIGGQPFEPTPTNEPTVWRADGLKWNDRRMRQRLVLMN